MAACIKSVVYARDTIYSKGEFLESLLGMQLLKGLQCIAEQDFRQPDPSSFLIMYNII